MLNSKSAESTACNTDPLYSSVSTCSNQRSVATNTSTLWPQIQSGLRKLTETLNEEEGGEEDSYSNVGEIRKSAIGVTEYLLIMNFNNIISFCSSISLLLSLVIRGLDTHVRLSWGLYISLTSGYSTFYLYPFCQPLSPLFCIFFFKKLLFDQIYIIYF